VLFLWGDDTVCCCSWLFGVVVNGDCWMVLVAGGDWRLFCDGSGGWRLFCDTMIFSGACGVSALDLAPSGCG
jgi:hypothetical protein